MWSFIISLVVGGLIGWIAEVIMKRDVPGGVIGNIILGFLGAWLGGILLGDLGPVIQDFAIIPAVLGAVIVVVIYSYIVGKGR